VKLPLWRLLLAVLVLAGMAAVLVSLAPVYLENYRLGQFVKQLARRSSAPDDTLRAAVLNRARDLDLPVEPADVSIMRSAGKLEIQTKCVVQMDFPLYQVDLHFHANASSR
jgi:hypothetical protein